MKPFLKYIIPLVGILTAILPPPAVHSSPVGPTNSKYNYSKGWYHRIAKGDTLAGVARKYHRSTQALTYLNQLNPGQPLQIGTYLYIPPTNKIRIPSATSNKTSIQASSGPSYSNDRAVRPGASRPLPPVPPLRIEKRNEETKNHQALKKEPPKQQRKSSVSVKSSRKFVWPLSGTITREYSDSKDDPHRGIDIAAPKGTLIMAAAGGKVIYSDDGIPGYGKMVIIEHNAGFSSVYAHNSRILVKSGAKVSRGTPIARVGSTGRASGNHLHFEIRKETSPIDPRRYLPGQ